MFYSQHGEDLILSHLFNKKRSGVFVEVGCIDGIRFSNTLFFEELGWNGLCIEAHEDYIDLLKKNRPNSIIEYCAAGEKNEESTFYANKRGSLSTLDSSKEDEFAEKYGDYFKGFEKQTVMKRRLSTIFNKHNLNTIDLLSIDIEGYEIEAVKGIDFTQHKPKVMVIESDTNEHEIKLDNYIIQNGYVKVMRFCGNIFYIRKDIDFSSILNIHEIVLLHHEGNPLYDEDDIKQEAYVSTVFPKDILKYIVKKIQGTQCYKSHNYVN